MIKELMLITTILYGNALPTFNTADKQPIKQLMTTSPNNNVSMGLLYLDITNNYNGDYYEYVPLTYTLNNIRVNTDIEEYVMSYYFQCLYTAGDTQTQTTINKSEVLDYNDYNNLINNINKFEFIVDISNLSATTIANGDTRLLTQLIVVYTISSTTQTYQVSQTYDLVIPLIINGTTITNFTINNTYRAYYTGFAIRSTFGDIGALYYDKGYDTGYDSGYDTAYDNGYDIGFNTGNMDFNPTTWLIDSVSGFMAFEIFPNFSIGGLLLTVTGALITLYIMKLLLGG